MSLLGVYDPNLNFNDQECEEIVGHVSMGVRLSHQMRVGFEELNMLAELYIEAYEFEKCISEIKQGIIRLANIGNIGGSIKELENWDEVNHFEEIPLPIIVKLGISRLHLNETNKSFTLFEKLYQEDPVENCELFFDVGEALSVKGFHQHAIKFFKSLMLSDETNQPIVWKAIANSEKLLGNFEEALKFLLMGKLLR